jgi:hypothetical protein
MNDLINSKIKLITDYSDVFQTHRHIHCKLKVTYNPKIKLLDVKTNKITKIELLILKV